MERQTGSQRQVGGLNEYDSVFGPEDSTAQTDAHSEAVGAAQPSTPDNSVNTPGAIGAQGDQSMIIPAADYLKTLEEARLAGIAQGLTQAKANEAVLATMSAGQQPHAPGDPKLTQKQLEAIDLKAEDEIEAMKKAKAERQFQSDVKFVRDYNDSGKIGLPPSEDQIKAFRIQEAADERAAQKQREADAQAAILARIAADKEVDLVKAKALENAPAFPYPGWMVKLDKWALKNPAYKETKRLGGRVKGLTIGIGAGLGVLGIAAGGETLNNIRGGDTFLPGYDFFQQRAETRPSPEQERQVQAESFNVRLTNMQTVLDAYRESDAYDPNLEEELLARPGCGLLLREEVFTADEFENAGNPSQNIFNTAKLLKQCEDDLVSLTTSNSLPALELEGTVLPAQEGAPPTLYVPKIQPTATGIPSPAATVEPGANGSTEATPTGVEAEPTDGEIKPTGGFPINRDAAD